MRGRAGIAIVPSLLIYGTGGFAYGQVTNNLIEDVTIKTGWTAGGGVEWMFLPNWSVKAEYLYSDISGSNNGYIGNGFVGNNGFVGGNWHNHERWNTVRAGLNYHFNWGARRRSSPSTDRPQPPRHWRLDAIVWSKKLEDHQTIDKARPKGRAFCRHDPGGRRALARRREIGGLHSRSPSVNGFWPRFWRVK